MEIPVSFEFEGVNYKGILNELFGTGGTGGQWQLMVNGFYWGRLRKVGDQWYFDESKKSVGHLKDYFAAVVIAWYQ